MLEPEVSPHRALRYIEIGMIVSFTGAAQVYPEKRQKKSAQGLQMIEFSEVVFAPEP